VCVVCGMQNFQIYDEIGKGEKSVVYKGRKKKSAYYFAIKSSNKSERNKVLHEVCCAHYVCVW